MKILWQFLSFLWGHILLYGAIDYTIAAYWGKILSKVKNGFLFISDLINQLIMRIQLIWLIKAINHSLFHLRSMTQFIKTAVIFFLTFHLASCCWRPWKTVNGMLKIDTERQQNCQVLEYLSLEIIYINLR